MFSWCPSGFPVGSRVSSPVSYVQESETILNTELTQTGQLKTAKRPGDFMSNVQLSRLGGGLCPRHAQMRNLLGFSAVVAYPLQNSTLCAC